MGAPWNYTKVCDSCDHTYEPTGIDYGMCPECQWSDDLDNKHLADEACAEAESFIHEMETQGFAARTLPAEYDSFKDLIERWRKVRDQKDANKRAKDRTP